MAYDLNGNILSKKETTFTLGNSTISSYTTKTYEVPTTSSASDILTKYNGQTVTTTNPGNITAIGSITYSWTRQHFLSQVYKSAYDYSTYSYAGNGVRSKKINYQNGTAVTHTYVTSKGRILKETITGGAYAGVINYLYLGNSVIGFTYNNIKCIFKKNLQNDIIGIYDEGDNLVASYVYDAWGNHKVYGSNGIENTSTTFIGNINPFRYRSYYYDRESKLYYCKARYYNPELCRWMSLDSIEYLEEDRINGCNLYVYCGNDPVNYKQRPVSSGGSVTSSSISVGGSSVSTGGSSGRGSLGGVENPTAPWWVSTAVGAIPDFILGMRYLAASGMHSKFAYATNTRYMHPIMGGTWCCNFEYWL